MKRTPPKILKLVKENSELIDKKMGDGTSARMISDGVRGMQELTKLTAVLSKNGS